MKRLTPVLLVVALSGLGPARAALPVPVSTNGILASSNVGLVLNIPDAGTVGGRFVDHWYFTTTVTGLRIYDVTDPELPKLTGVVALPHWENEDVDVSKSRKLALISNDYQSGKKPIYGTLSVISWADPARPAVVGTLTYPPNAAGLGGPGHIANCVADCKRYAYITGARDGSVLIVDLKDPAKPIVAGTVATKVDAAGLGNAVFKTGVIHNVDIDRQGYAWMTGSGGTAMLDVRNPLKPKPLKWVSTKDNGATNHFIHHNSLRLSNDTLLVTEEDYPEMCGKYSSLPTIATEHEGTFQTWRIDARRSGSGALKPLGQWHTELGNYLDGYSAATISCSSHWFTYNSKKVVAVGWYDQGVRFLDVSNPRYIRQVGYWIRPTFGLGASAALFVPGRPDLVYVADYNRGLDILRIDSGGASAATVAAPVRAEWLKVRGAPQPVQFAQPDPVFGWACLQPSAASANPAL